MRVLVAIRATLETFRMRAMDLMTTEVITVDENASIQSVAKLLADHGISALPVVDRENRVIGMISEGDLLHRAETATERRRSWWLEMVSSTNQLGRSLHQVARRSGKGRYDARRPVGHRRNPGRRYRRSAGDQPDQAGTRPARRQAYRHRQQSQPRAGARDDNQRGGGWHPGR